MKPAEELKKISYISFSVSLLFGFQEVIARAGPSEISVYVCEVQAEAADGKAGDDDSVPNIYNTEYWEAYVSDRAMQSCIVAELKKRSGQYDAVKFYSDAIEKDKTEPGYNIYFGDYYRNYRGPKQSLFDRARNEYEMACHKLGIQHCRNDIELNGEKFLSDRVSELDRGLVSLYERDGIPLMFSGEAGRPVVFLSAQATYMKVTSDSDERDDIREFTSEAMLIESRTSNPVRSLSRQETLDILRTKEVKEAVGRVRIRPENWPVIDLFYRKKHVENAQITDFDARSDITQLRDLEYNPLLMDEYGLGLEKLMVTETLGDYSFKTLFSRIDRKGLIEHLPNGKESVNNFEANLAGSRFFGRSKFDMEVSYVYQDITQRVDAPQKRDRSIAAVRVDYHLGSFAKRKKNLPTETRAIDRRFASRGVTYFGGAVTDKERFGSEKVLNDNYFIGISWKGVRLLPNMNVFDFAIRSTVFTSEVQQGGMGRGRENSQLRLGAEMIYKKIDEEAGPWPPRRTVLGLPLSFLHYVVSMSSDAAREGPEYYENRSLGLKIAGKGYSRSLHSTIFGSAGIDFKVFTELETTEILGSAKIGIGF